MISCEQWLPVIFSQTAWLLLEGNWAVLLRDREQLPEGIFDDRKIGRLEGGGGRAPRGLNNSFKSTTHYSHQTRIASLQD